MKIDTERIEQYLLEIKSRHHEIEELFRTHTDAEILKEPWVQKGIKYTLVEIAEAMANTLQHILSRKLIARVYRRWASPMVRLKLSSADATNYYMHRVGHKTLAQNFLPTFTLTIHL